MSAEGIAGVRLNNSQLLPEKALEIFKAPLRLSRDPAPLPLWPQDFGSLGSVTNSYNAVELRCSGRNRLALGGGQWPSLSCFLSLKIHVPLRDRTLRGRILV